MSDTSEDLCPAKDGRERILEAAIRSLAVQKEVQCIPKTERRR